MPKSNKNNPNEMIKVSSSNHRPLELVLGLSGDDDAQVTTSILEFFNLMLPSAPLSSPGDFKLKLDWLKTKKIIDELNFIRFDKQQSVSTLSTVAKTSIPSFSLVLLTNSPNTLCRSLSGEEADEQDDSGKTSKSKNWSFHYKIELNDERGKPIARQVFYRLNSAASSTLPLCCRSNWISPLQQKQHINQVVSSFTTTTQPRPVALPADTPTKYIIRLNINCQNYDLMLFFYRLLFEKCPNYSKKDFSLFVLSQHRYQLNGEDSTTPPRNVGEDVLIEFQLSLKNHEDRVEPRYHQNAQQYLVYNVDDPKLFDNIVRLLDGFVEPMVETNLNGDDAYRQRCYSVVDPDHNRIYLVDKSSIASSNHPTTGLADKYYSLFNHRCFSLQQPSNKPPQVPNNYSPNSNCSSSCSSSTNGETSSSFDSGKDSGNWSGGTSSTLNPSAPTSTATSSNINAPSSAAAAAKVAAVTVPIKLTSTATVTTNISAPLPPQQTLPAAINENSFNFSPTPYSSTLHTHHGHGLFGNYDFLTESKTNQYNQKQSNPNAERRPETDYLGVKHLIKKFSNQAAAAASVTTNTLPASKVNIMRHYRHSHVPMAHRSSSASCKIRTGGSGNNSNSSRKRVGRRRASDDEDEDSEDYDEYSDEEEEDNNYDCDDEEDNERELRNLLKKASNNSMFALNALAYRNKSVNYQHYNNNFCNTNKQSLIDLTYERPTSRRIPRGGRSNPAPPPPPPPRSHSALNEPYVKSDHFNTLGRRRCCYHFNNPLEYNQYNRNQQQQQSFERPYNSIGYSSGSRLLKSVLHQSNNNTNTTNETMMNTAVLNRKKSKSVTFMDALNQHPDMINKSFNQTPKRRPQPIIGFYDGSLIDNFSTRSKSTVPFYKTANSDDDDDVDGDEDYTCVVDVDNLNNSSSSTSADLTPPPPLPASMRHTYAPPAYIDRRSLIENPNSNFRFSADYANQHQPLSSLIDDNEEYRRRASRRHNYNNPTHVVPKPPPSTNVYYSITQPQSQPKQPQQQQQKPYVGITAATRFRRAHTLDMIRSTKMPVNVNTNPPPTTNNPSQSQFPNETSYNKIQLVNPKLVARF